MSSGKKEMINDISIRFCGIAGMGVITMSVILGKAAIYDKKNAVQTQSYGAEQRGSKVKSDVIISNKELINYPIVEKADILVALSQDAFEYYFPETKKESILIIDSYLVHLKEEINNIYKIPASELAMELKNKKVTNLIMLGYSIKVTSIVTKESILKAISDSVPRQYKEQNIQAFLKGYEYLNTKI